MSLSAFALPLLLAAAAQAPAAALPPCLAEPQPMPPALDSVAPAAPAHGVIAFAAVPWEYPGRAWVVRASRKLPAGTARLEIVRLRRQMDCNRYEQERRWEMPLPDADYRALAEAVAPLAEHPAALLAPAGNAEVFDELVLDGTGVELRWRRGSWEIRRASNHYARAGGRISAAFRALLVKHLPAAELPAEDWRSRAR